jgi:hypothetical protein
MTMFTFKFVVPANAGTHTPCPLFMALWQTPFVITSAGGYGAPRARGRRQMEIT